MKEVIRWYVSGFYKTPKGVKKPYNPILGEKFRCYWKNEETNSRTFYIAEQVCLVIEFLPGRGAVRRGGKESGGKFY